MRLFSKLPRHLLVILAACFLTLLMVKGAPVTQAQDIPSNVIPTAIRAAQEAIPTLGQPTSWEWRRILQVNDSSLGCSLVQGTPLGRSITTYRIVLTFESGDYVVYVSSDATLVQLCDPRFPGIGSATPIPGVEVTCDATLNAETVNLYPAPQLSETPSATVSNTQTYPVIARTADAGWYQLTVPDGIEGVSYWSEAATVTIAGDGCNTLQVYAAPQTNVNADCVATVAQERASAYVTPVVNESVPDFIFTGTEYPVAERTGDNGWYRLLVPFDSSRPYWVQAFELEVSGDNCGEVPVVTALNTTGCTLTPAGEFANVRSSPSTEAQLLTSILQGSFHDVFARNETDTWYLIEQGWVAGVVATLSGGCSTLQVSSQVIGAGGITGSSVAGNAAAPTPTPATATGAVAPTQVAQGAVVTGEVPAIYICLPDSDLYLPPRIQAGSATAQVEAGGIPNRLRTDPSTEAPQVGMAQPGRTFDEVIAGPACNQRFTWWLVEIDGVRGWTAESNGRTGEYFISPTTGGNVAEAAPATEAPAETTNVEPSTLDATGLLLPSENANVSSLAFSPDGTILITADNVDANLQVWDTATDERNPVVLPHNAPITQVAYSTQGVIATSDTNNTVLLWDWESESVIMAINDVASIGRVTDMQFSPDGALLATAGCGAEGEFGNCTEGVVRIWNTTSGEEVLTLNGHEGIIQSIDFNADGVALASASGDGVILWNVKDGQQTSVLPSENGVNDVAYSPDGTLVATAGCADVVESEDATICLLGEVRLWDPNIGLPIGVLPHPDEVATVAFGTMTSGEAETMLLVSGGFDEVVRVWEVTEAEEIATFEGHTAPLTTVAISAAGDLIASAALDNTVRLWAVTP